MEHRRRRWPLAVVDLTGKGHRQQAVYPRDVDLGSDVPISGNVGTKITRLPRDLTGKGRPHQAKWASDVDLGTGIPISGNVSTKISSHLVDLGLIAVIEDQLTALSPRSTTPPVILAPLCPNTGTSEPRSLRGKGSSDRRRSGPCTDTLGNGTPVPRSPRCRAPGTPQRSWLRDARKGERRSQDPLRSR